MLRIVSEAPADSPKTLKNAHNVIVTVRASSENSKRSRAPPKRITATRLQRRAQDNNTFLSKRDFVFRKGIHPGRGALYLWGWKLWCWGKFRF